ncbi:MAG: ATP-binding cassette domain-containing protein [Polyangiaceae bacterium]
MTEPSEAALLRAENVSVVLGGMEVLRGISLRIQPGEIVGVLGPSGAGKSTLFRALTGELVPTAGTVLFQERDVTLLPLWRRARLGLGYVPQTASVLFDLSVADNLATFERAAGVPRRDLAERASEVELEARLDVLARDLSGGERRRLELCRALTGEPRVLVCDEPLAGVDPSGVSRMGRVLRGRADAGMAVLVADHRVREALEFCHRALLLLDGRIELETTPAEFLEHPKVRRRYLG